MEHIEKRWLIILRHGESEGNVDEQIYKEKPTSELKLTETGKKQATSAGRSIVSQQPYAGNYSQRAGVGERTSKLPRLVHGCNLLVLLCLHTLADAARQDSVWL